MLVLQIAAGAMFFPFLLRDLQAATAVIVASWPMTVLAGMLSAQLNAWKIVGPCAIVTLWLAGLGTWLFIVRSRRGRMIVMALATALSLGGPLVWYLRAEFSGGSTDLIWNIDGKMGPVMAALALCDGSPRIRSAWGFIIAFILFSLLAALVRWLFIDQKKGARAARPGTESHFPPETSI